MPFLTTNSLAHLVDSAVSARSPQLGRVIHAHIVKAFAFPLPDFLSNHLINMYAKLDKPDSARLVLSLAATRSVVTWTSLIAGSVQNGRFSAALADLAEMLRENVLPNDFTLPCAFKATASVNSPFAGRQVHAVAVKLGEIHSVFVGCGAFDMYAKTDQWNDARKLFDEMPVRNKCSWNAYISNSVLMARPQDALSKFVEFVSAGGEPDRIGICAFLNACSDTSDSILGRQCHGFTIISGLGSDTAISNGLIDFYGKCNDPESSERVFARTPLRNEVSWCSMIAALVRSDHDEKACETFLRARREGVGPNGFMISAVLSAIAGLSGLNLGQAVHALAARCGSSSNVFVAGALVDMYGKCGNASEAERAFAEAPEKNSILTNAVMSAHAALGNAERCLEILEGMKDPNRVTFVSLLSALGRAGAVEKGVQIFESMEPRFGVEPGPEHYACVVDLLGRAGFVDRAYEFVKKMPIAGTISIWGALLGACKMHRRFPEIGKIAAENLFRLDPKDSGNHVLLSNMLASSGRWEEADEVRKGMKEVGIKKNAGYSWISVQNTIHAFQAKDTSHERNSEIRAKLRELRRAAEEAGHVAETSLALFDVSEEEKAAEVWEHSEKIALAFALLALPPSAPLRITKNLRICADCHGVMKLLSGILRREILVRDNNRFHRFQHGVCSCSDYW